MPVAGRKPKPDGQRRNRMKPVHDWVEVPEVPFSGAPSMPKVPHSLTVWRDVGEDEPKRVAMGSWPAWSRRWWRAVSTMPHAALWSEADWQFVTDTLLLVACYHSGDLRYATEIRQREAILGMTVDARRNLRIRYVDPETDGTSEGIADLADYRSMVGA